LPESKLVLGGRTAPAAGSGELTYAFILKVPSDLLSTTLASEKKRVTWLPPAPSGGTTVIEFLFTREEKRTVEELSEAQGRTLISYTRLPNGDAFIVTSAHEDWIPQSFRMPGVLFPDREYVVATDDPNNTGRPARVTIYVEPKESLPLIAWEYGAYWVPLGTKFREPMGTITRAKLLKYGGPGT
jgi:hypothetical protein